MKRDAAQKYSQCLDDQSLCSVAPQEIAMALSLSGVRFYIPSLSWPEASSRKGKHWNNCAPQSCWGKKKKHAGIQHCLRLYTDSQHTRQKRFTHPVKRETVTCSSQGKPTLVFMDIFSLADHKLSGGGFRWGHESVCVRVCTWFPTRFFSTLHLTLISI